LKTLRLLEKKFNIKAVELFIRENTALLPHLPYKLQHLDFFTGMRYQN